MDSEQNIICEVDYRIQAWEFMLSGGALYNHMDYSFCVGHADGTFPVKDPTPGGGGATFRKQMRHMGTFIRKFDFLRLQPDRSFVSGNLAKQGGFTSMAQAGRQFALYIKDGAGTALELNLPPGNYTGEWLNAFTGETVFARAEGQKKFNPENSKPSF
jgi:hypothetical protein